MELNVTLATICAPSENVVAREIEGEIIIVSLVSGISDAEDELYALNETGQAIWEKLDGERTLKDVAASLAEEFHTSKDELESDVIGFATELTRRKILRTKD